MIRFGKYGLEPDTHSWKLGEIGVRKDKKSGEDREVLLRPGYHSTIQKAIEALLNHKLIDADPSDLLRVSEEIQAFRAELAARFSIRVEGAE